MVRMVWMDAEFPHSWLDLWLEVWTPGMAGMPGLMTANETAQLAALPDPVPVFRGCNDRSVEEDDWEP
jgi:hypothetical protein